MGNLFGLYPFKHQVSEITLDTGKIYGYVLNNWYVYKGSTIQIIGTSPFIDSDTFDMVGGSKSDLLKTYVEIVYLDGPKKGQQHSVVLDFGDIPFTFYTPPDTPRLKAANKVPRVKGTPCDIFSNEGVWYGGVIETVREEIFRVTYNESRQWLPLVTDRIAPFGSHSKKA